ncbi:hypothetical protein [Agromyces indicus]|uniref:Uncharacterized protein n=1 Tax=Agromyces indicus TaxID=758919 RepID=A0ABU1FPD2_9MICO|nr:hypothetical protein [Agromyces indicus]MDR5693605.1 hypothetical protein [Agromyces indicus]
MQRMRPALLSTLIASALLAGGGIALFAITSRIPVSFGFVAYGPLTGSLFAPDGFIVLTTPAIIAAVIAVVGAVGFAGAAGFAIGHGRSHGPAE